MSENQERLNEINEIEETLDGLTKYASEVETHRDKVVEMLREYVEKTANAAATTVDRAVLSGIVEIQDKEDVIKESASDPERFYELVIEPILKYAESIPTQIGELSDYGTNRSQEKDSFARLIDEGPQSILYGRSIRQ